MSDVVQLPIGVNADDIAVAKRSLAGKALVRMVAMAVLLVMYFVLANQLDEQAGPFLESLGLNEQWRSVLILGLPVLLALVWLVQEAVCWFQARRLRLTTFDPPPPGYFRIAPYSASDQERYGRPDGAHSAVLQWAQDAKAPLLYLTGRSGCGKSSLISAWLKPELEERNYVVCLVRGHTKPLEAAAKAIAEPGLLWQRPPNDSSSVDLIRRGAMRAAENGKRLFIFIDQFEEFLILNDEVEVGRLRDALKQLSADPVPGLTLLLVFRSDYEDLIEALDLPRLHQGDNWAEVGPFSKTAALDFLQEGIESIDKDFLERLLKGLGDIEGTPGRFRPVTLNMAGLVLEREAGRLNDAPDQLIHRFVSNAVKQPEIVEVAPQILAKMITDGGTKRPRSVSDISAEVRIDQATARGCLRRLATRSLVRSIDEAQETWEISHDFLAQVIGQSLNRLQPGRWRLWSRWLAPVIIGLWTISLVAGAWHWKATEVDRATAALAKLGFTFRGDSLMLIESDFDDTALMEASPHLEAVVEDGLALNVVITRSTISDLTPLAGLNALKKLDLSYQFEIRDVTPIAGLTALQELTLWGTQVSDVTPLASLTALQRLDLSRTEVSDVTPLDSLTALLSLDLTDTKVSDLAPLAELTVLEQLYLAHTEVSDVAPLAGLTTLQGLDLTETEVSALAPLAGLTVLEQLYLAHTEVSDVTPLANLTALQRLDLSRTEVSDVTPLDGLTALLSLDLTNTKVSDLAPLAELTLLEQLYLAHTEVRDVTPLASLTALERLFLHSTAVEDFTPVDHVTELRR